MNKPGGTTPPPSGNVPEAKQGWQDLTRPDAILRLLREHGQPMGPSEIATALMQAGRAHETPSLIYSTIDKLKKRGQIANVGYGKWALAPTAAGQGVRRDVRPGGPMK